MMTQNQIYSAQWTEAVGRAHNYCEAIDRRGGSAKGCRARLWSF